MGGSRCGIIFITRIVRFANSNDYFIIAGFVESFTVNKIRTISILFILFLLNPMTLKIIEPIKQYLKVFNSPDEFNIWYTKNKDEVDTLTTHKLNKMYKIEGYRITKIKNVLMLKKINNDDSQHSANSILIPDTLAELQDEIKNIKSTVNQIIQYLNGNQQHIDVSPASTT